MSFLGWSYGKAKKENQEVDLKISPIYNNKKKF